MSACSSFFDIKPKTVANRSPNGFVQFQDKQAQAKVRVRLRRLKAGLFGDCEPVGDGVLELRENVGAGYRVYFGRHGRLIVILLCGGTKKTQAGDIKEARKFWADWKRRQA